MVDPQDKIIQEIATLVNRGVFNSYCVLIFREVGNLLFQADNFSSKTLASTFIESSKDLLGELLEGLALLQTPSLPTYIPVTLSISDMDFFREIMTHSTYINPRTTSLINPRSSLDIIDFINKQIERDITAANLKNIRLVSFIPYVLLRPILELDPITFSFVYKTSFIYSYRTANSQFLNPTSLYTNH